MPSEAIKTNNEVPDWAALHEAFNNADPASEEEDTLPKGWYEMGVVDSARYINNNNNPVVVVSLRPIAQEHSRRIFKYFSTLKEGYPMEKAKRDLPILGFSKLDQIGIPPTEMRIISAYVAVYDDDGIKRNRIRKLKYLRTEPLPDSDDSDFAPTC